jgi:iron complex transport system substrate-binding protein
MRVVSLLPAATEIVCVLGGIDQLVGVTHECDYPSLVRTRPCVTRSVVDPSEPAAEIHARVRALSAGGEALFVLDADRIEALRPDLILTQAICDVCAVSEHDVRALARHLTPEPGVVTLGASTLHGVRADIARVGDAIGLADEALELAAGLELRLRSVHLRLKRARAHRPRVAVLEWIDPVFAAGHWVPEMVHRAGGVDVLAEAGEHSRQRDARDVREASPDIVVVAPCGQSLERAAVEAITLLDRPEWNWARERVVWAMDANAFVSRPGPRLVRGVEAFARMFHPLLFSAPARTSATRIVLDRSLIANR